MCEDPGNDDFTRGKALKNVATKIVAESDSEERARTELMEHNARTVPLAPKMSPRERLGSFVGHLGPL